MHRYYTKTEKKCNVRDNLDISNFTKQLEYFPKKIVSWSISSVLGFFLNGLLFIYLNYDLIYTKKICFDKNKFNIKHL